MNDFAYLAYVHRGKDRSVDLLELAFRCASTPGGPLHSRHTSLDRESIDHLNRPPKNSP